MIEYEVNLQIDSDIYDEFKIWLANHIKELLHFDGFTKARLFEENSVPSNVSFKERNKITIRYELDSPASLQKYFDNHAPLMRQKTEEKFGGKYEVSRRVLTLDKVFQ